MEIILNVFIFYHQPKAFEGRALTRKYWKVWGVVLYFRHWRELSITLLKPTYVVEDKMLTWTAQQYSLLNLSDRSLWASASAVSLQPFLVSGYVISSLSRIQHQCFWGLFFVFNFVPLSLFYATGSSQSRFLSMNERRDEFATVIYLFSLFPLVSKKDVFSRLFVMNSYPYVDLHIDVLFSCDFPLLLYHSFGYSSYQKEFTAPFRE